MLRVEVLQLLEECFRILDSDDVKDLFGAENAWDVVDEVLIRYFDKQLQSSPRQRMGVTGRDVLRWLAAPHILETARGEFEALLMEIAEPSEEWLTSAQAMSLARRTALLDWARSQRAWIVEDDYDGEFQYGPQRVPALCSMAHDARVLYVGTFSKSLGAGLRLGYMVVPAPLALLA